MHDVKTLTKYYPSQLVLVLVESPGRVEIRGKIIVSCEDNNYSSHVDEA